MPTLKALLFTIAIVLTILATLASAYILYIFMLGTAIVLLFLIIRSILKKLP